MAMGAGAVLLYQKYNEPVSKAISKKMQKAGQKMENMM